METITCPHCQAKLSVPESALGGSARCPRCQAVFPATPGAPPPLAEPVGPRPPPLPPLAERAGDDRDEDRPGPRPGGEGRPAGDWQEVARDRPVSEEAHLWRSVRAGAGLYLAGHVLYLCGLGIFFFIALLSVAEAPGAMHRPGPVAFGLLALLVFGLLMVLANWALAVVGAGFWLPAPVRHGSRGLAVGCLVSGVLAVLEVPALLLSVGEGGILGGPSRPVAVGPSGLVLWPLVQFSVVFILETTRLTLFPFFLRSAGRNLRSPTLVTQGLALGIGTPLLLVGLLLFDALVVVFRISQPRPGGFLSGVLLFINLFVPMAVVFWGALTLLAARHAIGSRLRYL